MSNQNLPKTSALTRKFKPYAYGQAYLLTHTPEPARLAFTYARGTTAGLPFSEVWARPDHFLRKRDKQELAKQTCETARSNLLVQKMEETVSRAVSAGHLSVTRGITFTFGITCSRSISKQLMRQVVGTYWQEKSQRYVTVLNEDYVAELQNAAYEYFWVPDSEPNVTCGRLLELASRTLLIPEHVLVELVATSNMSNSDRNRSIQHASSWFNARISEFKNYIHEVSAGIPPEDARENLPNAFRTELIVTIGFEALKNFLAKRLCTRAQEPVRYLALSMRKQVGVNFPWMLPHLGIQCTGNLICPEMKPDGCRLLLENGGNVHRASSAVKLLQGASKQQASYLDTD